MRLEQLRYAEVAIRLGSLRRAAQELGIAQPSLSIQIQRLEEELGVVLLVRRPNGVRATDAALALLPHVRSALRAEQSLRQEASAITGLREGRVRLGTMAAASRLLMPNIVRRFRQEYPAIHFQVTEGGSEGIRNGVAQGDLDLGIVSRFVDDTESLAGLAAEDLTTGALVLCIPTGHRLQDHREIVPEDLDDEDMIVFHPGYLLRTAFDRFTAGRTVHPVYYTDRAETATGLVAAGVGVAILSGLQDPQHWGVPEGSVRYVPISGPWARTTVSRIRRSDEQPTPAARVLARMLREEVASIVTHSL